MERPGAPWRVPIELLLNITGSRSNDLNGNFRGLSGYFSCADSGRGLQRITEANCVSLPPDRSEAAYGPFIQ
jgi:hypothetical protein